MVMSLSTSSAGLDNCQLRPLGVALVLSPRVRAGPYGSVKQRPLAGPYQVLFSLRARGRSWCGYDTAH